MQNSTTESHDTNKIIITPPSGWQVIDLDELWYYRDLLFHLVWRNVKVRYKQTILGVSWAVIQPLVTMVVFTIFFGNFAQIPSDGIPYPIFSFTALVPWTLFSAGLASVALSITSNVNMLKKIYFPRLLFPVSQLLSSVFDFIPAFIILIFMVVGAQIFLPIPILEDGSLAFQLTWNVIWVIPLLALTFITTLGFGLWLAALNVQFRDVRYATNFIIRLWLFITPVIYPVSLIDENLRYLYYVNPMTGVIDGFRWAVLGTDTLSFVGLGISSVVAVLVLISGLVYFNRTEKWFADVA